MGTERTATLGPTSQALELPSHLWALNETPPDDRSQP